MMRIVETSECLTGFTSGLSDLTADGKQRLTRTAGDIVRRIVETYGRAFGTADVGAGGSGITGLTGPSRDFAQGTTGLLYGKVQSGKTNTTVASTALAVANGFRVVVVLTSDNTLLGRQTFRRFRDGLAYAGPRVHDWESWNRDPEEFGSRLRNDAVVEDTGIVLVSTKNVAHLKSLEKVLRAAKASGYPGLIIDDEADHASLNTLTSRNAGSGANDASAVFEQIGRLRKVVPRHVYLQVTATPQSLLLQTISHPSRPVFCAVVEPGDGYTGGDVFFDDISGDSRLCVEVDASELQAFRTGRVRIRNTPEPPDGLRKALSSFCVALAQQTLNDGGRAASPYSALIHVSHRQIDHDTVAEVVSGFLVKLDQALRGRLNEADRTRALGWIEVAYKDLARTAKLEGLSRIIEVLQSTLRNATPSVVNAEMEKQEIDYRKGPNILIGGNRLGRGLTIPGLMTTYYLRDPRTKMADTVHQHARMFGYRRSLVQLARLFTTRSLLNTFAAIHESDEGTREALGKDPANPSLTPVWVGEGMRATRSNVLNPSELGVVPNAIAIYPPDPHWRKSDVRNNVLKLDRLLRDHTDDEEYVDVDLEFLKALVSLMPSSSVAGYSWDDRRVLQILSALQQSQIGISRGRLNVRRGPRGAGLQLRRQAAPFKGFADSAWVNSAKQRYPKHPTLLVMMQEGSRELNWDNHRVYLPTLVLPQTGFVFMFTNHD